MKPLKLFFASAALMLIVSCEPKGAAQRSAMVLDTLAESPEKLFYKDGDSLRLDEPLFYDSSKSMLLDNEPSPGEEALPEKSPLPIESKK